MVSAAMTMASGPASSAAAAAFRADRRHQLLRGPAGVIGLVAVGGQDGEIGDPNPPQQLLPPGGLGG